MRRGRKKGGNKEKVFGCDLREHLLASSQEIPLVLRCCSEFIEEHGIVDGIYRLSGVSSNTQKLRGEFDSEGSPDLKKDVYMQDIHCVSSLCKAYFRELPDPLLTYQLYDKFAEAVAIQLEEERLVKIKEVLKELPPPHYRTLEYLMRHLVRMASHSSQTNMHVRNLAIVWAPNLLRSKDIEATAFHGTAAFMEVRVQSIVVEFILTHVAQLFPEPGHALERRQSLPSPSALSNHEDPFFKSLPFQFPATLSPGDGPPLMRPYHVIIEGTDKKKGSLKGRKWKSIFNLGGKLHDPRRKSKASSKEKDKTSLRPAKSMDSLSSLPYSQEGTRPQQPPCQLTTISQLSACPSVAGEAGATGGGGGGGVGSRYAVTYRRGGGASVSMVGGDGTPGTYHRLEQGGGTADGQNPQPKSPGMASRAERRAGIHISGPFSVTVPLHITSSLALGVLQGAGGERGEEDRDQGRRERRGGQKQETDRRAAREEGKDGKEVAGDSNEVGEEVSKSENGGRDRGGEEVLREGRIEEEAGEREKAEEERSVNGVSLSIEETHSVVEEEDERQKSPTTGVAEDQPEVEEANEEEGNEEEGNEEVDEEYVEMRGGFLQDEDCQEFSLEDTFGFLDLMDSSTMSQAKEFSVEPPCFEEGDEDEKDEEWRDEEEKMRSSRLYCDLFRHPSSLPATPQHDTKPERTSLMCTARRMLPLDLHSRAIKTQSLPHDRNLLLPVLCSSDEEEDDDREKYDEDDEEEGEEDDENALFYSLPSEIQFHELHVSGTNTYVDLEHTRHLLTCPPDDRVFQPLSFDIFANAAEPLLTEESLEGTLQQLETSSVNQKELLECGGARLEPGLECGGARLEPGLECSRAGLEPALECSGAGLEPALECSGAGLEPTLECSGARSEPGLECSGAGLEPGLECSGARLEPGVECSGAGLEPALECSGAGLEPALECSGARLEPGVECSGAGLEPGLECSGAGLEPGLDCSGAGLEPALECSGAGLEPDVECSGARLEPALECSGAGLEPGLECSGAGLEPALECSGAGLESGLEPGDAETQGDAASGERDDTAASTDAHSKHRCSEEESDLKGGEDSTSDIDPPHVETDDRDALGHAGSSPQLETAHSVNWYTNTGPEVSDASEISDGLRSDRVSSAGNPVDSLERNGLAEEVAGWSVRPETPAGAEEPLPTPPNPQLLTPLPHLPNSAQYLDLQEGTAVVNEEAVVEITSEGEPCLDSQNLEERPEIWTIKEMQGESDDVTERERGKLANHIGEDIQETKVDLSVIEEHKNPKTREKDEVGGETQRSEGAEERGAEFLSKDALVGDFYETQLKENRDDVKEVQGEEQEEVQEDEKLESEAFKTDKDQMRIEQIEKCDTKSVKEEGELRDGRPAEENLAEKLAEDEKFETGWEMGPGQERTPMVSKPPNFKVQQAKSSPIVPPKPRLSRLAALNLRQQLQQRESDRGVGEVNREKEREGTADLERERREVEREADRETKRNRPISRCFDEAVARATERRGREREEKTKGDGERAKDCWSLAERGERD